MRNHHRLNNWKQNHPYTASRWKENFTRAMTGQPLLPRDDQTVTTAQRRRILQHYGNVCYYCHESFPEAELEIDHVLPRSRGGQATEDNLVVACKSCNRNKSDRTPEEWQPKHL